MTTKSYFFIPDVSQSSKFEKVTMDGIKPNFDNYEEKDMSAFMSLEVDDDGNQTTRLVHMYVQEWTESDDFILTSSLGLNDEYAIRSFAAALNEMGK